MLVNAQIGTNTGTNLIGTLDYGLTENISIGAGIWHQSISFLGTSVSATALLGRGAYHFTSLNVDKLDLFAGAEVAVGFGDGATTSFSIMPGARYLLTDNIGLSAELPLFLNNGGGSQLRIGATFKF
jgi:hypothetical protein